MTTSNGTSRRRRYTNAERAAAIADAEEIGQAAACRKHGVPQGTLSNWQRKAAAAAEPKQVPTPATTQALETPPSATATGTRVGKRYTPSQRAQAVEYAAKHGVSAASG